MPGASRPAVSAPLERADEKERDESNHDERANGDAAVVSTATAHHRGLGVRFRDGDVMGSMRQC